MPPVSSGPMSALELVDVLEVLLPKTAQPPAARRAAAATAVTAARKNITKSLHCPAPRNAPACEQKAFLSGPPVMLARAACCGLPWRLFIYAFEWTEIAEEFWHAETYCPGDFRLWGDVAGPGAGSPDGSAHRGMD